MHKVLHLLGIIFSLLLVPSFITAANAAKVTVSRVPNGGIQPQVVVDGQTIHLIYFKGNPQAGDIFYVRSVDNTDHWTAPLRVNSQAGSATAMGTIRGATLAVGKQGRVFVVWNGSDSALPRNAAAPVALRKTGASPLLYSRMDDTSYAFEPQRNMMTKTFDLDGGANVAADAEGHVYIGWHAQDKAGTDESSRRVWLRVSNDGGATFTPEKPVWNTRTGACGCCQLGIKAWDGGKVALLYRSATELVHRDTYLLQSTDAGASFQGQKVSEWNINACPMTTFAIAGTKSAEAIGWESVEQVYFSRLNGQGSPVKVVAAPGNGKNRKYPSVALGQEGELLLTWTEENGWGKNGVLRFQLFDGRNQPIGEISGKAAVPLWSFAAAFTCPNGNLSVLY